MERGAIPDFEKDAAAIAEYEAAKTRFERTEAAQAESSARASYARKRANVLAEIAAAQSAVDEKSALAEGTLAAYREAYPRHARSRGLEPPTFWERLLSFGRASRAYAAASKAAEDLAQAQATYRRRQRWEEELESWLRGALHRVSVELKERTESPDWLEKFHAQPEIAELYARVKAIRQERAAYAKRLEAGMVTPAEQRDRYLAEGNVFPLRAPFEGVMIEEIKQFGEVSCWIFADFVGSRFWLPYDRRLEGLVDSVFDTYRLIDELKAKFNRSEDGRRTTALDHLMRRCPDESEARFEWRKRIAAIRAQKDTAREMPVGDQNEKKLLDLLATLASTNEPA